MSECQTKAGNQKCLAKLAKLILSISHSLTLDMLNNFSFHVYAQKSVVRSKFQCFFLTSSSTPSPVSLEFLELVPAKKDLIF